MVISDISVKDYPISTRVSYDGNYGTILFVGQLESLEGSWLGIDWDSPTRGKHNGTYNGVQYFCASHPTSGSFVRPNKVDYGCTFLEAIRGKYISTGDENFGIHLAGTKTIEFVGMDRIAQKQSQLQRLTIVILDHSLVNRADDDLSNILNLLPNVVELHMCHTLLSDWTEVERICRYLNKLTYLNLSTNKYKKFDSGLILHPLTSVHSLILTECQLCWEEVDKLSILFPNIVELGLCRNRISYMGSISFQNLRSLDLDGNAINSLSNVAPLLWLTSLETLNLSNTGLMDFELQSFVDARIDSPFPSLKILYLCNNALTQWQTINELSKLPCLEHLLTHGNPLLSSESYATSRQFIIAKIKNLKILDRQVIFQQERLGAEIDYLKFCGKLRKCMDLQDFKKEHPRYDELCKAYGAPEDFEMKNAQSGLLKDAILDLNISVPGHQTLIRKIPSSMIVQKLKALIGRIYRIDVRGMQLSYESSSRPGLVIALDNDLRDLAFYSIGAGDKIVVDILQVRS